MDKLIRFKYFILVLLLMGMTSLIYTPGLTGGFVFDDFPNIVHNERLIIDEVTSQELVRSVLSTGKGGPLDRPMSMLTFSLNIFMSGMDPYSMKLTNLLIHCSVGIVIFLLLQVLILSVNGEKQDVRVLTNNEKMICLIATSLWMVHPFNLTGVLYIVQRMTSLSAFFVFSGLLLYCYGRLIGRSKGLLLIFIGLFIFGPLALYSKENGVLLYVFILLYELFIYKSHEEWTLRNKHFLFCLFLIILGISISVGAMIVNPDIFFGGYVSREFTLEERLFTQPRILWYYIGQILLPINAKMSLYHDNFEISKTLTNPAITLPAIASIFIIIFSAVIIRRKYPLVSFLVLFFFAGHLVESTFLPLEMVFEHRNYLPSIALILLAVIAVNELLSRIKLSKLKFPLASILLVLFSINTAVRASQWGDSILLPLFEVEKNPSSARANFEAARAYAIQVDRAQDEGKKKQYIQKAKEYWFESIELDQDKADAYISLLILHLRNGLPIEASWLKEVERIISEEKVTATTTVAVPALFKCLKKGECYLGSEQINSLIRHAVGMKQVNGKKRGIILQSISGFLWDYKREYKNSMDIMELAISAAPEQGQFQLDFANMLLATGNNQQCASVIAHLDAMDKYGAFEKDIEKIRRTSCVQP